MKQELIRIFCLAVIISCFAVLPVIADVGPTITKSAYLSSGSYPYQTQIQISSDASIDLYSPAGADFDLYAKQGGDWPSYTSYRYDYTLADTGSAQNKHLNVGPGLWYFSIDPVYGSGTFTFTARSGGPVPPPVPTYQPSPGPCTPVQSITKTGTLDQYEYDLYTFTVNSARTELDWQLFGPQNTRPVGSMYEMSSTADADFNIYIAFNAYPTERNYDWADTSYGPDGSVTIKNPKLGYYYVMVKSLKGSGNYQLNYQAFNCYSPTPTTTPVGPCTPIYQSTKTGTLNQGGYSYYSYAVGGYRTLLSWKLTGPHQTRPVGTVLESSSRTADADFNIYIALNRYPTQYDYDWAETTFGPDGYIELPYPSMGTYYVMVYAKTGSGSYTLEQKSYNCGGGGGCSPSYDYVDTGTLSTGSFDQYSFDLEGSKKRLRWDLTGPQHTRPVGYALQASSTADADYNLYVARGRNPSPSSYDWADTSFGPNAAIEIQNPVKGTYYARVYAMQGNGAYQLQTRSYNC